jgi:hypothetical protein
MALGIRSYSRYAAENGHAEVAHALIDANASVDQLSSESGCSALFVASQNGHADVVRVLLDGQAKVDQTTKDNCAPLLVAAQYGHTSAVAMLLGASADANKRGGEDGQTPLVLACQRGHADVVRLLCKASADVDMAMQATGVTPLVAAAHNGHAEVARLLVESGANAGKAVRACGFCDCAPRTFTSPFCCCIVFSCYPPPPPPPIHKYLRQQIACAVSPLSHLCHTLPKSDARTPLLCSPMIMSAGVGREHPACCCDARAPPRDRTHPPLCGRARRARAPVCCVRRDWKGVCLRWGSSHHGEEMAQN